MNTVDLSQYNNSWYSPGRSLIVRLLWHFTNTLFLYSQLLLSSRLRVALLRLFGAQIGRDVVIKPGVRVKYPWHLIIGDHVWIGEDAWLDSLARIRIGSHVCISQGAYLCTGNHDWSDPAFGLIVKPITIEDGSWIGARSTVTPGIVMHSHSILTAGSVLTKEADPYGIYCGNPAIKVRDRTIRA